MTKSEISASTLKGDVRDFLLTWIQSMDTPFHKMSESSQRDVIWAAEAQAHNLISAITMAIAGRGFDKAFVRVSDFSIKDGIVSKITADATQTTVLNFLGFKGKAAVLVFADPAVYASERRPARYFPDEPDMFTSPGVDDEPDGPAPGDGGAGGGEAKELPKEETRPRETRPRKRHGSKPQLDGSQPGGEMPNVPITRINQAFVGDEPEDPIEGDLWRDRSGSIWGRRDGKWVDPKGNERPADPPAPIVPPAAETKPDAAAAPAAEPGIDPKAPEPGPSRDRRRTVGGSAPTDAIEGDVWVPASDGNGTAFTFSKLDANQTAAEGANFGWLDATTGEVYTPPASIAETIGIDPEPLSPAPEFGDRRDSQKPVDPPAPAKPKNRKLENPAKPGTLDPKDPGEPPEVTEDSGQPVITRSTGEPHVDEDAEA